MSRNRETYVTALQGFMSPRYALMDLFSQYGSHALNNARGWMADWGHGAGTMYEDVGELSADPVRTQVYRTGDRRVSARYRRVG